MRRGRLLALSQDARGEEMPSWLGEKGRLCSGGEDW